MGVAYVPRGLPQNERGEWEILILPDVEVTTDIYVDLAHSDYFLPPFAVQNVGGDFVRLIDARIVSKSTTYTLEMSSTNESWYVVEPATSGSLGVFWEFDEPIETILGDNARMILTIEVGEQVEEVEYVLQGKGA